MAQSEIHSENASQKRLWSEEFERMPLKQRLKLLLASNRISVDSDVKSGGMQNNCDWGEFDYEKNSGNKWVNSNNRTAAAVSVKVCSASSSLQGSLIAENLVRVKVECGEFNFESRLENDINVNDSKAKSEAEMNIQLLDELDHVVLKERLRWLLKRTYGHGNLASWIKTESVLQLPHAFFPSQEANDPVECLGLSSPVLEASHKLSAHSSSVQTPSIPSLANVKVEPPTLEKFHSSNVNLVGQMSSGNFVRLKTEVQTADDDDLDHMLLRERMKLLSSRDGPSLNTDQCSKPMSKMGGSAWGSRPVQSKPAQSVKINRPRKRRKTATDSVETAMEEDAPGLLQVLIEKGVSVSEIRLYGGPESNDDLNDSFTNDSFGELEEVIMKLFSKREPLLKSSLLRCSKGEKASYCLECLFSLVEQARYLQFRHWPVEWGWCRDLQSFIFVFERHNRVVLERPEYGYATYFFELTDSLPIAWQVKRLVIAMKLTSCSRVTLLENKALMVGDDLSEGEAKVLMEYGWLPNTGLGTMLNYYDRVVHDRRNEKDGSEWRSKIGKFLMEGFNSGTLIPDAIPAKVMEYNAANAVQIKLELS